MGLVTLRLNALDPSALLLPALPALEDLSVCYQSTLHIPAAALAAAVVPGTAASPALASFSLSGADWEGGLDAAIAAAAPRLGALRQLQVGGEVWTFSGGAIAGLWPPPTRT